MAGYKTKTLALAEEHGIEVDNYAYMERGEMAGQTDLNLPKGYTIAFDDDRTGLVCPAGGTYQQHWGSVFADLRWLVKVKSGWYSDKAEVK